MLVAVHMGKCLMPPGSTLENGYNGDNDDDSGVVVPLLAGTGPGFMGSVVDTLHR